MEHTPTDERAAFEEWARDTFVCSEHSFVRAHPYGYINTVSSQTFGGRVQPNYADVQMLWKTWEERARRAALAVPQAEPGWKLVPVEPTPEMLEPMARSWCKDHGIDPDAPQPPHGEYPSWYEHCGPFAQMYKAMLAAAPQAQAESNAPSFKSVGNADFHMSATLDVCIGDELFIRAAGVQSESLNQSSVDAGVMVVAPARPVSEADDYHAANQCVDAAVLHLLGTTEWPKDWMPLRDQFLSLIRTVRPAGVQPSQAQSETPKVREPDGIDLREHAEAQAAAFGVPASRTVDELMELARQYAHAYLNHHAYGSKDGMLDKTKAALRDALAAGVKGAAMLRDHLRDIDLALAALVDIKPMADYGEPGTYDTVQARRQKALLQAETAMLSLRRDLIAAAGALGVLASPTDQQKGGA